MYRLYDFLPSGNGYKVRLLLTQLEIPFERVELNILKGKLAHQSFLSRIPTVEPVLSFNRVSSWLNPTQFFYLSEGTEYLCRASGASTDAMAIF